MKYFTHKYRYISKSISASLICLFVCYKSFVMSNSDGLKWTIPLIIAYVIICILESFVSQSYNAYPPAKTWYDYIYQIKYIQLYKICILVFMIWMLFITCKNYNTNTWQEWAIGVVYILVAFLKYTTYKKRVMLLQLFKYTTSPRE